MNEASRDHGSYTMGPTKAVGRRAVYPRQPTTRGENQPIETGLFYPAGYLSVKKAPYYKGIKQSTRTSVIFLVRSFLFTGGPG